MKEDRIYVGRILECVAQVDQYTQIGPAAFSESRLVQDAVLRNLQVLAESSQRLSEDLKTRHPEIRWRGISAFRNVLVHDYLGIGVDEVWNIVEKVSAGVERSTAGGPGGDGETG